MQNIITSFVDLSLNENQYGVAYEVEQVLKNISINDISKYCKEPEFKTRLAELHGVCLANLYVTAGAEEALKTIFSSSYLQISELRGMLLSDISWPYYAELANKYFVPLLTFSLNNHLCEYRFNIDIIIEKIHFHNPSVILLDSPHNPVGSCLRDEEIMKIYSQMSSEQILVIDETYFEFAGQNDNRGQLVKQLDNLVIIRSFSKYYGLAGLRIGYMLIGSEARNKLNIHDNYLGFNIIADQVACTTLANRDFYAMAAQQMVDERESIFDFFNCLNHFIPYRSKANFLLVKIVDYASISAKSYVEFMVNHGIKLKLYSQGQLANSVRITIGTPKQMQRLKALTNQYIQLNCSLQVAQLLPPLFC
ncbi:MAG: histidinol-phosphate transaminase [Xenococcaceae cyanobacterium]